MTMNSSAPSGNRIIIFPFDHLLPPPRRVKWRRFNRLEIISDKWHIWLVVFVGAEFPQLIWLYWTINRGLVAALESMSVQHWAKLVPLKFPKMKYLESFKIEVSLAKGIVVHYISGLIIRFVFILYIGLAELSSEGEIAVRSVSWNIL